MFLRSDIVVVCFTTALVAVLHLCAAGTASTCTSDADCSGGQRCVEHFNMSVNANCDSYKYCIDVSDTSCSCYAGYSCRLKDCPSSPYECLFLEDTNHRCGAPNEPCNAPRTCEKTLPVSHGGFCDHLGQILPCTDRVGGPYLKPFRLNKYVQAPVCQSDETCTYVFNQVYCYKCPCYGQFNVTCLKQSNRYPACVRSSIATLYGIEYSCEGCRSASSVLVAPN